MKRRCEWRRDCRPCHCSYIRMPGKKTAQRDRLRACMKKRETRGWERKSRSTRVTNDSTPARSRYMSRYSAFTNPPSGTTAVPRARTQPRTCFFSPAAARSKAEGSERGAYSALCADARDLSVPLTGR